MKSRLLGRKLKGFTLLELMIVTLVLAVIATVTSVNLGKRQQNSKIDQTEMTLRSLAHEIEAYITDFGEIKLDGETTFSDAVEEAVNEINTHYSSALYDLDTLEIDDGKKTFTIMTLAKKDGFGSNIQLFGSLESRIYILASPGKNKEFEFLASADPTAIDDILVVIQLK